MGRQLEAHGALCAEPGESPASVALAWLLANPVVSAPIIGPEPSPNSSARCGLGRCAFETRRWLVSMAFPLVRAVRAKAWAWR
jgi:hypothetical protein